MAGAGGGRKDRFGGGRGGKREREGGGRDEGYDPQAVRAVSKTPENKPFASLKALIKPTEPPAE
ncbi:MAG: hypothetical protein IPK67_13330 [Planctomycetes bacterium]|nr:hypothetical protein [Planctomycetota bacterium]